MCFHLPANIWRWCRKTLNRWLNLVRSNRKDLDRKDNTNNTCIISSKELSHHKGQSRLKKQTNCTFWGLLSLWDDSLMSESLWLRVNTALVDPPKLPPWFGHQLALGFASRLCSSRCTPLKKSPQGKHQFSSDANVSHTLLTSTSLHSCNEHILFNLS